MMREYYIRINRSIVVILLATALIITSVFGIAPLFGHSGSEAYAAGIKSTASAANDGVDFSAATGLLAPDAYIYYGTYKHVTAVTKEGDEKDYDISYKVAAREKKATPILWRVTGEEKNSAGKGDGYISAISQYVLDVKSFRKADDAIAAKVSSDITSDTILATPVNSKSLTPGHTESKQYAGSSIQSFLNGSFLKSFSGTESARIPKVKVVTNTYKLGQKGANGLEILVPFTTHAPRWFAQRDTVFAYGSSTAKSQKVYLPWITSRDDENAYASPAAFSWDYQESLFYSADGTIYANDKYNKNNAIIRDAAEPVFETSALKGTKADLAWITRSPCPGYHAYGNLAEFGGDLGYSTGNSQANNGVKPVTKFDPKSVVFAAPITASGKAGTLKADSNYKIASKAVSTGAAKTAKTYKLTILTNNGKVVIKSLKNGTKSLKGNGKEKLTVKAGKSLTLKGSVKGADKLAYKIVATTKNGRQIVGYGAGSKTSIKIKASKNFLVSKTTKLSKGSYTLYVWAQDNQAANSNVASKLKSFKLTVK